MPEFIAANHDPSIVLNGGAQAIAERLGLGAVELANAGERRSKLAAMEPSEVSSAIIGLNGLLRGLSSEDAKIEDGKLPMMVTPRFEDKRPLLDEATLAFKQILSNTSLDDAHALRRAGLTIAGALAFIHPFLDGNGRTGRLFHYFTEFGNERGTQLFEAETYSAIGKIAVFDIDKRRSIESSPHPGMERALNAYIKQVHPELIGKITKRQAATLRVQAFLDAMSGKITVPMLDGERVSYAENGKFVLHMSEQDKVAQNPNTFTNTTWPVLAPGTSIVDAYEQQYVAESFAAHVAPHLIPGHAKRVEGVASTTNDTFLLDLSIVS
ncbi:MAG TPA: Fic family protein [Candidatus Saccharimonadales bacterium]|nr:Fic family protein [Candidatus Saccharimonadales bacterium]